MDTGVGIPKDKQESIFEAFTQADASTTREFGGTGLGLAISKSIIELLGGRLTLESEVGVGSNFIVDLAESGSKSPFSNISKATQAPFQMEVEREAVTDLIEKSAKQPDAEKAAEKPESEPESPEDAQNGAPEFSPKEGLPAKRTTLPRLGEHKAEEAAEVPKANPGTALPSLPQDSKPTTKKELRRILPIEPGKQVLIVDDDPDAREFLGRYIEDLGAGYRECDSGSKAVEMIKEYEPDLVTLDISMPGINGWDTLALIKKNPETANVPVIIVSILADRRKATALPVTGGRHWKFLNPSLRISFSWTS